MKYLGETIADIDRIPTPCPVFRFTPEQVKLLRIIINDEKVKLGKTAVRGEPAYHRIRQMLHVINDYCIKYLV